MKRQAVISGVGVVSAFGVGAPAFFDGLATGACAVGPIRSFDASAFPTRVAGEVPTSGTGAAWLAPRLAVPWAGLESWDRSGALRDRKAAFALLAAAEAWRHAGCGESERSAWLSLALGMEQVFVDDLAALLGRGDFDFEREPALPLPPVRFRAPFDTAAAGVRDLLGLRGLAVPHASACAGGALAVAHAASIVERGWAEVVVCGAADSMINPMGLGGISRLGAPSPRNEPDACRPFDRRRDGMVIGEGAAVFVVEEEARARARGARPLARVLGWGSTQDAWRLSAPRPDGSTAGTAIRRALLKAGLSPEAVDYVNAHGTGTPLNDPAEAKALHAALGEHAARVPVSSIKGAVGHLMAGSGAIEIAACLLAFGRGLLPGTANHRDLDPACPLNVLAAPQATPIEVALSNSFGFGGQNAAVVLGRCA